MIVPVCRSSGLALDRRDGANATGNADRAWSSADGTDASVTDASMNSARWCSDVECERIHQSPRSFDGHHSHGYTVSDIQGVDQGLSSTPRSSPPSATLPRGLGLGSGSGFSNVCISGSHC